jgi:SRSO17 transposase
VAQSMVSRALDAGVPCAWVTGDSVYGSSSTLRQSLQTRRQAYVLALANDERLSWEQGRIRALTLAQRLSPTAWQTLSCGEGAKGPRLYDWAWLPLDAPSQEGFAHWLLVRRSLSDPRELAYYLVFAPLDTALATLVAVAGTRWSIEAAFESAKGEVGMDHYEVRSWQGWYRHMTFALLAQALLAVIRHDSQEQLAERLQTQVQEMPSTSVAEAEVKGGSSIPRNSLRHFKQQRGLCCL